MTSTACKLHAFSDLLKFSRKGPAYHSCESLELLHRETGIFILLNLWPLISPDHNPVEYQIEATMQERAYRTSTALMNWNSGRSSSGAITTRTLSTRLLVTGVRLWAFVCVNGGISITPCELKSQHVTVWLRCSNTPHFTAEMHKKYQHLVHRCFIELGNSSIKTRW